MQTRILSAALLSAAMLSACAEDLTAVTAAWTTLSSAWTTAIGDAKKAGAELADKATAVKLADGDATAADLKAKFDAALGEHTKAVADMQGVLNNTQGAVDAAIAEKKIAPVQKAIDDGKAAWDALSGKLGGLATGATDALTALTKHTEAAAAAAAAAPAGAAKEDETSDAAAIKKEGAVATFGFTFKDDGSFDDKLNADILKRFLKFMNTCEVMKIELTGMSKDEKSGVARATQAKKYVEKRGVPGSRVGSVAGKAGGDGLMAKVVKACP